MIIALIAYIRIIHFGLVFIKLGMREWREMK